MTLSPLSYTRVIDKGVHKSVTVNTRYRDVHQEQLQESQRSVEV